ncbi:ATP-dependent DNA helicase [Rhizobium phaseoli]|uniref:UvrD-helicase domain-containing protein n=1 Tax=Rhizobium phaseoli TaxID=396 RepID=UPI000E0D543B|nr:UvrD-helicase domain-containing protein [Rhizobium phaseoli]RDJ00752.1 ATP-dependent DNA helicase [Rhizobium phaseoli]RDJ00952.1 ATP-dependent DNA helicase [Rhizobium phaseoli]
MVFVWQNGDLNDEQTDAVRYDGSVFLAACPGSGKTRALTYKIALELSKLESERHWVVAITYTHRAAEEIAERIERLGVSTDRLWIGTIHSFCLDWIIRPYAIYHDRLANGFRVIDQHETDDILTELCQQSPNFVRPLDCRYYFTTVGFELEGANPNRRAAAAVLQRYWDRLREHRQLDFEMILSCAHDLIASNPSISVLLGSLFRYILVDEYQDTKEIQYAIIAAILRVSAGNTRTFIVGDPNQAIYGSLGGYAMTRPEFEARAGVDLAEKSLSNNYRSSERIVGYFSNYCVVPAVIEAVGKDRDYGSFISFDQQINHQELDDEIVRLIRHNIETLGISPREICVVGPQWVQLAAITRRLVAALPEYNFDGPGMAPFSRDQDNIWFKISRLALTRPEPQMFVRRMRWAGEVLEHFRSVGIDTSKTSRRDLLRHCNQIEIPVDDGLEYLELFFDELLLALGIDIVLFPSLDDHRTAFFERSRIQIERLENAGVQAVSNIAMFRRVFAARSGITISTIHGVKGAEFDSVIAFALLEGMVPHFADSNVLDSAKKLLYVIASRPRKNLHLIAEVGRVNGIGEPYETTNILAEHVFGYDLMEAIE